MTAKRSSITISDCRIMEHEPERQCLARRWGPRARVKRDGAGDLLLPKRQPKHSTALPCSPIATNIHKQLEQVWP